MNDTISVLVGACELANEGIGLIEKLKRHFPSAREKELLRAAAQSGEFHIIKPDQVAYPIIRAGGTDMGDENDPASLAEYYEAFKSLCSNGYIEYADGAAFRLTADGFKKARNIT
ncbi:MAG: hypothetical protein AB1664_03745 [Thermodesulfobacteriota bacterium]